MNSENNELREILIRLNELSEQSKSNINNDDINNEFINQLGELGNYSHTIPLEIELPITYEMIEAITLIDEINSKCSDYVPQLPQVWELLGKIPP